MTKSSVVLNAENATQDLTVQLGALLLAATNAATQPFVARIEELETQINLLMERFTEFENSIVDNIEKVVDAALDNLDVEATITSRR